MLFNSIEFLVFFVMVFAVYWALPWRKARVIVLLAASYYFYISWNAKLAAVVGCSSLVDFFLGRVLERSGEEWKRKGLLIASIVMNMGLLVYFKYANFFLHSMQELLDRVGVHGQMPVLNVILPIGISFYTFEAISYMVDLYHRRIEAEKNPLHFLLFISFFPRMVAGPIIRARNFLPQLKGMKQFDAARFELGLKFVLMGLFKKMAIADRIAALVDPVYDDPTHYSTAAAWIALLAYSLQIYCDFSGYSDVAIGTAHMLGFKLPENFNMPYLSKNISEFWRRWHISLSTWLRDYVFISLGGSRGTELATAWTLMVTMTVCGLWHGANWTFIAWGAVQGIFMVAHRLFRNFCKARPALESVMKTGLGQAWRVAFTFIAVTLAWVVFRSPTFATAGQVFHALLIPRDGAMVRHPVGPWSLVFALAVVAIAHGAAGSGLWKRVSRVSNPLAWGLAYAMVLVAIFLLAPSSAKPFIYFQF